MEQTKQRSVRFGEYLVEHRATVRSTAAVFSVSKSTVHKDLTTLLPVENPKLWQQVKGIPEETKSQRHLRGGLATREKYRLRREKEQPRQEQPP